MKLDKNNLLESILASIEQINNIKTEELPNIDLYMDQVTTFMEEKLRAASRNPGSDKILTKTMINNYAKNDLLPPPVKKKYNKEHLIVLIFIYYCKSFMSIQDIQDMLGPLTDKYFDGNEPLDFVAIYNEIFDLMDSHIDDLKNDISAKYELSQNTFEDIKPEDREMLQLFSFISLLSYDVYVKKLLVEKLLDTFNQKNMDKSVDKKKKNSKNKS